MRDNIQQRYQQAQEFYRTIERGIGYQSLEHLIVLTKEVITVYPDHPDGVLVQTQLESQAKQYKAAMAAGVCAVAGGRWQAAYMEFERARQVNPGAAAVINAISFINQVREQYR